MRENKLKKILDASIKDANELKIHYTNEYINGLKKLSFSSGGVKGSIEFNAVVSSLKKAQSFAENGKDKEANSAVEQAVKQMENDIKSVYVFLKGKEKELTQLVRIYKETL